MRNSVFDGAQAVTFCESKPHYGIFRGAVFLNCSFHKARLRHADFSGAIRNADFSGATTMPSSTERMLGLNLCNCQISGTDFSGCNILNTQLPTAAKYEDT